MARVSGSWNHVGLIAGEWQTVIDDVPYLKVGTTNITLSSSSGVVISGGLNLPDSDVTGIGGFVHSYTQYSLRAVQGTACRMTSSYMYLSASDPSAEFYFLDYPMVRSGSVIGLCLRSPDGEVDDSNSGAITASVAVNDAATSCQVIVTTGAFGDVTVAKDTDTFNPGDRLYVIISASADYDNSVAASCSWVANILVES